MFHKFITAALVFFSLNAIAANNTTGSSYCNTVVYSAASEASGKPATALYAVERRAGATPLLITNNVKSYEWLEITNAYDLRSADCRWLTVAEGDADSPVKPVLIDLAGDVPNNYAIGIGGVFSEDSRWYVSTTKTKISDWNFYNTVSALNLSSQESRELDRIHWWIGQPLISSPNDLLIGVYTPEGLWGIESLATYALDGSKKTLLIEENLCADNIGFCEEKAPPVLSSDKMTLFYVKSIDDNDSFISEVYALNLTDLTKRRVYQVNGRNIMTLTLAPDDKTFSTVESAFNDIMNLDRIMVVNSETGEEAFISSVENLDINCHGCVQLAFSPESSHVTWTNVYDGDNGKTFKEKLFIAERDGANKVLFTENLLRFQIPTDRTGRYVSWFMKNSELVFGEDDASENIRLIFSKLDGSNRAVLYEASSNLDLPLYKPNEHKLFVYERTYSGDILLSQLVSINLHTGEKDLLGFPLAVREPMGLQFSRDHNGFVGITKDGKMNQSTWPSSLISIDPEGEFTTITKFSNNSQQYVD